MKKLSNGWKVFGCLGFLFWIGVFIAFIAYTPDEKELTPEQKIEKQFSPVDGRHYNLQFFVEDHLDDPDSFEHVQTRYAIKEDHILVQMTYRARNRFNALILKEVIAKVDLETGNLLEIVSEN